MKKMSKYNYDVQTNTLTMSPAFAKQASRYGTPEYNLLMQLRHDYPGLKVEVEASRKTNHGGLSFEQMENHIHHCKDANKRICVFEKVKALSKSQANPYAYVKKWFMENYANYSETPELDDENFVVVKTKKEVEAEKAAAANAEKTTSPTTLSLVKDETAA